MTRDQWILTHAPTANPEQARAVRAVSNQIACVAGPGSGKTRTVVWRIKCLQDTGSSPASMVTITFTNKAAAEIQERLEHVKLGYVGTVHGYCLQILQEHGRPLGYQSKINILDNDAALEVMQECRAATAVGMPVKKLMQLRGERGRFGSKPRTKEEICVNSYIQQLRKESCIDFDLILEDTEYLLRNTPGLFIPRIEHLLVDEFQDSSALDFRIYKLLPAINRFYVGDPDQGIYAFRGARLQNILDLCKEPETLVLNLEGNYRSGRLILERAQPLIENNVNRIKKATIPKRDYDGSVQVVAAETELDEARLVAMQCKAWLREGVPASEIAVLGRSNVLVNAIAAELKASSLPLIDRRQDDTSNAKLRAFVAALQNPNNNRAVLHWIAASKGTEAAAEIRRRCKVEQRAARELCTTVFLQPGENHSSDILNCMARAGFSAAEIDPAARLFRRQPELTLDGLALALQRPENAETGSGITCTTLHGSKGLEFDCVWIAGMEQDSMPGLKPTPEEKEEERRLFYVGVTRAKNQLIVSHRKSRRETWGKKEVVFCLPSQFLNEMMGDSTTNNVEMEKAA